MKKRNLTQALPRKRNPVPVKFMEIISMIFIVMILYGCASLDSKNYKSRLRAVNKVTDQNILYQVALKDTDDEVKTAAFNKITDENLIKKVAFESKDQEMRLRAVHKLTNQYLLYDIVLEGINDELKTAAFDKLTDEYLINKLPFESTDPDFRLRAINKITDQDILYRIVLGDTDNDVRSAAFDKITDENLINKLALESKDQGLRLRAVNKITDQNILYKVTLEDKDLKVKSAAFKKITDQDILYQIALKDEANMRGDAMKMLSPGMLAKLAFDSEELELKMKVVELLSDQNELRNISENISEWDVRQKAFRKLDEHSLALMISDGKDPSLVLAAKIRLGRTSWSEAFSVENSSSGTLGDVIGAAAIVDTPQPKSSDVVKACHTYIKQGDASRIPELINLLNRFGDVTLAEDYLNCGNEELYDAGANWGRAHGYNIGSGYGSHRVRWGQK